MSDLRFNAALPTPHDSKWMEATPQARAAREERENSGDSPRVSSYQPPGGEAIPFILRGFRFSGGQSKDTAEYPFGGLWSNEYLNEKPQRLHIEGFLRGREYIIRRTMLIEALRVPTCDDRPGYIDLPFWGRFPVVVGDGYEVSEDTDEQGQCRVSIPFTRAGVSVESRSLQVSEDEYAQRIADLVAASRRLQSAAVQKFETDLNPRILDTSTFRRGFAQITTALLSVTGRIQGARRVLNTVTGGTLGILSLINQGITAPRDLALALFNAAAAILAGILEIRNSAAMSWRPVDNARNVLLMLLSADTFRLPGEASTVSQDVTQTEIENLYRTMAYVASAEIIAGMDFLSHDSAAGCWRLLERLEGSIDKENPAVHAALCDVRSALSRRLSMQELSAEMTRRLPSAAPILFLTHYLGCGEDTLRRLNSIADSFLVEGDVIYV